MNNFENISFNPFFTENTIFTDNNDPDQNYFNDLNSENYDTPYIFQEETKDFLQEISCYENLSLLQAEIHGQFKMIIFK